MRTDSEWTKPYHGVQHYGTFSRHRMWATVTDRGSFADAYIWHPGCGLRPQEMTFETAKEARKKCACIVDAWKDSTK